jgi:hypothetical protein
MDTTKSGAIAFFTLVILLTAVTGLSTAASKMTVVATVADGHQLVDEEGFVYEVENTPQGNELVLDHIGRKVKVTGTVKDEIDYKVIIVDSFQLIDEE